MTDILIWELIVHKNYFQFTDFKLISKHSTQQNNG